MAPEVGAYLGNYLAAQSMFLHKRDDRDQLTFRNEDDLNTWMYYKDFPGMSKPVFMVSVCSSVKIKGRDCGTINGHDESSSIRALMKDAREVLVR
ncbi:TPA: hypothetical protein I4B13_004909 [Enterobacter hormaechei subsp. hoffmannii]|nr:hypothetical protein [Enterobacter hormaechei subsp. hoffmannii]